MFEFLRRNTDGELVSFYVDYIEQKHALTELAIEVAVGKIADVVAKCGFLVYTGKNDADSKELAYMLNVRPNKNQLATEFWKVAIHKMIHDPEGCLIVNLRSRGLFVADSWQTDDSVLTERKYNNVTVSMDGHYIALNSTFKASDVMHLRYPNEKAVKLLKMVNTDVESLYNASVDGFGASVPKVKVMFNGHGKLIDSATGQPIATNEYAERIAKQISAKQIKSIVAQNGIDVSLIEGKSMLSTSDIDALRNSVLLNTSVAFGIPKSILMGDVVEQSNDEFLTYACEPVISVIDNACCAAFLSKNEYIKDYRVLTNKLCMKHVDVINSAGNLDKLYQNGWNHNEVLALLGLPPIDEDWAYERRFTKNYATEGGEDA